MSYNYNQVYYYEHDCTDFSTTGECGDLMPVECLFEEQKNGLSRITMRLAYDPWGKWAYPKVGGYVKAAVPVRVPPMIVDGNYASTVARYETTSSRVNVYVRQDENSPITAVVDVGQRIYGKNTPAIIENFIPTVLKPYETDAPDEKRLLGYFKRSSVRKVEEISIVPASYGMESITDLVTRLADQYFQIVEVTQGDEYVDVVAEHVFYELLTDYTSYKPDAQTEISGSTCVNQILAKAYGNAGRFNISSSSSKTLKGIDFERKNIVEALLDPEKGACALYGMVLLRDNWDIYCLPEEDVGYDRGFVVEYGKNLASIKHTEDISKTITRIFPYGKTSKGEARFIGTGTKYVDSTHIDDYWPPRVMLLDTGITIGKDGVTESNIDSKLREAAQKEYDDNKIDVPRLTMEVDFVSLGDTEEYAQFRNLDKVYLYDKIKVIDRFRGYQYAAEVVGVVHNVRTGVLEKVTLGSLDNTDAKRKVAVWQVPEVDGTNIRLKSIGLGVLGEGSVDAEAILNGAVTGLKIADLTITNAKISNAGIEYAKIKELNAESAYFGQSIFEEAVGEKLYVPRLMFDTAQGRQVMVKDMVIGASNGKYYRLDISETDDGISMVPTELTVSASEIAAGHTNDGKPIIATTATVQDLSAENIYSIDALIDRITAKRINVDELFASSAFIGKLNVQDLTSNTYIHASLEAIDDDITDLILSNEGLQIDISNIEDGTTPVGALDNTHVSITSAGIDMKTGGTFTIASGNFSIDSNGVYVKGEIEADSGSIGGWTIGTDSLYAGTGTNHVELSTASGDYAFWAGAESASNAPFRVTKDGKVYSSKFIILNEQGGESVVDLRNYSLWKLGYATIKSWSVDGNNVTIETTAGSINFSKAASVTVDAHWSGATYEVYRDDTLIASTTVSIANGSWASGVYPVYVYASGSTRTSAFNVPAPSIDSLSTITLIGDVAHLNTEWDCTVTYGGTTQTKKVHISATPIWNAVGFKSYEWTPSWSLTDKYMIHGGVTVTLDNDKQWTYNTNVNCKSIYDSVRVTQHTAGTLSYGGSGATGTASIVTTVTLDNGNTYQGTLSSNPTAIWRKAWADAEAQFEELSTVYTVPSGTTLYQRGSHRVGNHIQTASTLYESGEAVVLRGDRVTTTLYVSVAGSWQVYSTPVYLSGRGGAILIGTAHQPTTYDYYELGSAVTPTAHANLYEKSET